MSKLLIWDPAYGTALGWGGNLILAPCCGKSPGSGGYNIPPAPPQSLLLAIWQTESQDLQNHKCRHQVGFLLISQCLQVSRASKALSRTFFAPQPPPNDASSKNATGFRRKPGPGSFPLEPSSRLSCKRPWASKTLSWTLLDNILFRIGKSVFCQNFVFRYSIDVGSHGIRVVSKVRDRRHVLQSGT